MTKPTAQDLDVAIWDGELSLVERIATERPELLTTPNDHGNLPLIEAVQNDSGNRTQLVAILLRLGADPNQLTEKYSPIHEACSENMKDVLKALLEHGGDPNLKDQDGDPPLMSCITLEALDCARILLEHGADVHYRNKKDLSYLDLADGERREFTDLLLAHGAQRYASDAAGLQEAISDGDVASVERIATEHPELLKTPDDYGDFPLTLAVQSDSEKRAGVVELLLRLGADPNQLTEMASPIHQACSEGKADVLKLLLENGGDANLKDPYDDPPLETCMTFKSLECVRVLLEHGADIHTREGYNVGYLGSVDVGECAFADLLISHGVEWDASDAVRIRHLELFKKAITQDPPRVNPNADIETLMEYATMDGGPSCVKILLERRYATMTLDAAIALDDLTRVNQYAPHPEDDDLDGQKLHIAIRWASVQMAELLLNAGLKPPEDLLFDAIRLGRREMVECLLDRGVWTEPKGKNDSLPLATAVRFDQLEIAHELLRRGADPCRENKDREGPLVTAVQQDNIPMCRLLVSYGANLDWENLKVMKAAESADSDQMKALLEELRKSSSGS